MATIMQLSQGTALGGTLKVGFKLLTSTAKKPTHAHAGDAGWDVYADETVSVLAGQTKPVSLGIALDIPDGWFCDLRGRSGIQTKTPAKYVLGTIDNGYRGEIKAALFNIGGRRGEPITVHKGDKVAQLVFLRLPNIELVESDFDSNTERGTNGFGSTGVD